MERAGTNEPKLELTGGTVTLGVLQEVGTCQEAAHTSGRGWRKRDDLRGDSAAPASAPRR